MDNPDPHSARPLHLDEHLCFAIYATSLAIQRSYKPLLDEMEITYPQYLVLNLLWTQDRQTVSRLANTLALEPSTITPMLKRLELRGHVQRQRNPQDERQVLITLTEKGRALQSQAACLGELLVENAQLSDDDFADLNQRIRTLRDNLEEKL